MPFIRVTLCSHGRNYGSEIRLRNNPDIEGFKCYDKDIKTSMYEDDTSLLLSNLDSLKTAIDTIEQFSQVAGPKLNKDKTEGILLGPLKDTINEIYGIKFTNKAVRCLGIYVGHDKKQSHEKNWTERINKMMKVFERWGNRHLTLFGKILIVKSLAASILVHPMSILSTPNEVLKEIEKMIFKFLWDAKDRIKRKTLIGDKTDGGLKMLDIFCKDKSLKCGWISRISNDGVNSSFLNMYLSKFGVDTNYLIKTTLTDQCLFMKHLKLPKFWAEVFSYVNQCKTSKEQKHLSDGTRRSPCNSVVD